MKELIIELEDRLKDYRVSIDHYEKDKDSMNYEQTEVFGFFVGKKELLEELIPRLKNIK